MGPTIAIALLWLGFAASHMGLSSLRVRPRLVARMGEGPFLGFYSLVSFLFFVPLVWVYLAHRHAGPWLWAVPMTTPVRWAVNVAMGVAFVLLVAGFARPSPASFRGGAPTARGVQRITRHPVFMAFGILGLAHLVPNGSAADVAFFGGFPLFAVIGARHQDQRKLATGGASFRAFHEATPFLPFTGRATLRGIREMPPLVIGAGVVLAVAVRYAHPLWFGR